MTTHEVRQAARVSQVSDNIDSLPREWADAVWSMARDLFAEGKHSFLTCLELALTRTNAQREDDAYCREHDC